ncbi:MAG: NAD(P)H-dependent oxidoreductase, partial [Pseudomonas sp.]|nr:NAD(P)H-dependent oxidoreductase [Pseudomonas sp.]
MSHVLIVESSARQQDSISRQLTRDFTAQWRAAHPTDQITVRDVAANPVPHLDADLLGGWMNPQD